MVMQVPSLVTLDYDDLVEVDSVKCLDALLKALPESVRARYEAPDLSYCIGWSHGKEKLSTGKADVHKGSYYANPVYDQPPCSQELRTKYPEFYGANIWPTEHLPELEASFKHLGQLIVSTGHQLAQQCDRYISSRLEPQPGNTLSQLLSTGGSTKARLLHYYPPSMGTADTPQVSAADSWCGWHTDHGALTGLTAAMYISSGAVVPNPDPSSGLYIKTCHGNVVQVNIPDDHIAFQVGEVLQIVSGGAMLATPHCVRAPSGPGVLGVSRNTLAVFLQPDLDCIMQLPSSVSKLGAAVSRWQPGMRFGDFCHETLKTYYAL